MTFTTIRTEILDRLNLSSSDASTRVGRLINQSYRRITSDIGLHTSRETSTSTTTSIGSASITFTGMEKIGRIWFVDSDSVVHPIREVPYDELREITLPDSDSPTRWAVKSMAGTTVTILLDAAAETVYSISADGYTTLSDLSGTDVPAFPESYHDVLIEDVLTKEYKKIQQLQESRDSAAIVDKRMGQLRLWIAMSHHKKIRQNDTAKIFPDRVGGSGSGSGSGGIGQQAITITEDWIFDNDPGAPFVVTSGSAVVANLDADKLDGFDESAFAKLADSETITGTWSFPILAWSSSRGYMRANSNGVFEFNGNSGGDFNRLQFGGTTSSFGAIKSNGTSIAFRLADDSADVPITASDLTLSGGDLIASANLSIRRDTSDGSDSGQLSLTGAGAAADATRGASIRLFGNENASTGKIVMDLGNIAGSSLNIRNAAGSDALTLDGTTSVVSIPFGQLAFPATQNASSNANTFDDYEEGTFTPTLVAGTSGTITLDGDFNTLQYTKFGNVVTITGYIIVTSVSAPTGTLEMQGLPFTITSTAERSGFTSCAPFIAAVLAGEQWRMTGSAGNTTMQFSTYTAGTATFTTRANQIQATSVIQMSFSYFAAT